MTYLFAWVVTVHWYSYTNKAWLETGNYDTPTACHQAAKSLNINEYRCITKGTGEAK